jgi:hypothetical protein
MAEDAQPEQVVSVQEVAVSNAFELAALIAVLKHEGLLTHQEVLDEISRQKKGRPRGR